MEKEYSRKMCGFTHVQLQFISTRFELIPINRLAAYIGPIPIVWPIIGATLEIFVQPTIY